LHSVFLGLCLFLYFRDTTTAGAYIANPWAARLSIFIAEMIQLLAKKALFYSSCLTDR